MRKPQYIHQGETVNGRSYYVSGWYDPDTGAEASAPQITSRRDYTLRRLTGDDEKIRVLGWESVECGIKDSERWPFKIERWCRVKFYDDGGVLLMHPDRIAREAA